MILAGEITHTGIPTLEEGGGLEQATSALVSPAIVSWHLGLRL